MPEQAIDNYQKLVDLYPADRAVEYRIVGAIFEIGDQHRDGRQCGRRDACRRGTSQQPHSDAHRERHCESHHHRERASSRRRRRDNRVAVVVEPRQRGDDIRSGLVAIRGLSFDAARDDLFDLGRGLGLQRSQRLQRLLQTCQKLGDTGSDDALRACEHVVQNQPEGVDVTAMIGGFAFGLLGRHVAERAHHGPAHRGKGGTRNRLSNSEVCDQGVLVLSLDHDVGRFEIPMYHTGLMRRREARRDLACNAQRARQRKRTVARENRGEIRAADVRHRDVLDAVDLAEVVDADDVLVRYLARDEQLTLEATIEGFGCGRIVCFRPMQDGLERDGNAELVVPRVIDRAHPSGAEKLDDSIASADDVAGRERRRASGHGARP